MPGNKVVYLKNPNRVPRESADGLAGGWSGGIASSGSYIPDQNTALAALTNGEADIFELPQADFILMLQKNANIKLAADALGNQGWLRPNHLLPPFNNPKARQARPAVPGQPGGVPGRGGLPRPVPRQIAAPTSYCGSPNETMAGAEAFKGQNLERASS